MSLFRLFLIVLLCWFGFYSHSQNVKTAIDSSDFYSDQLILNINTGLGLGDTRFFIEEKGIKEKLLKNLESNIYKLNSEKSKYILYMSMAYSYYDVASYDEAQPLLIKALKISEALGNSYYQCVAYNMIGNLFAETNMYESGVKNFYRAIDIARKKGDSAILCTVYGNLASCFYRNGEGQRNFLDSARKYNKMTIEMATKLNKSDDLHLAYQCLGLVETDLSNFTEAEIAFRKALKISTITKKPSLLYYGQYQLGRMYVEKGDKISADSAIKYLKLANKAAIEYNDQAFFNETLYEFARVYNNIGDYKQSSYYALRFAELNDSLMKLENARTIAELSEKYESVKNEAKISELNLSQKEKQTQIDRQLYLIIGTAIVLIFIAFIAFSLYRSNKIRKKINTELSEKNVLIEMQKKEVESQKELVELKNKEIVDSIHYAKRIQQSLLPTEKYILRNLDKSKNDDKKTF